MELWSNLNSDQKKSSYCRHLEEALKAFEIQDYAEKEFVEIQKLEEFLPDPNDFAAVKALRTDGTIPVFCLPGNNYVVPSFSAASHECPLQLRHIRNLKCTIRSCREKRTKQRTLMAKQPPMCLHSLLCHAITDPNLTNLPKTKEFVPKIKRDLSIDFVIELIQKNFPNMVSFQSNESLRSSRQFVDRILHNPARNEVIRQHTPTLCYFCDETILLDWPFKTKHSFLLSMGHIAQVEIPLKVCPTCKRVFYPGKCI